MKRRFRDSKTMLLVFCVIACVILLGCERQEPVSTEIITIGFSALSDEQLDLTILDLEGLDENLDLINIHGLWVDPAQALEIAHEIKRLRSIGTPKIVENPELIETTIGIEPTEKIDDEVTPEVVYKVAPPTHDLSDLEITASPSATFSPIVCTYNTAAELVASCPTAYEIQKIRSDFNIVFDDEIIENDIQAPWNCMDTGDESSIMLSMYNSFRLFMCVPFDQSFPWALEYDNLYEWMLSLDLVEIKFFMASEGQNSHAWPDHIAIIGNNMADPMYRDVINPQSGVGVINLAVLLIHEARHAGDNIMHNCGYKDSNLEYMGAWAVQYYLLNLLAEHSSDFFTAYEIEQFAWEAESLLETRFCELE